MKPVKTYDVSCLQNFKTEAAKYLEEIKDQETLETILAKSKKEVMELIKAGCTPSNLRRVFKNADIDVTESKLKQLFYAPTKSRQKRIKPVKVDIEQVSPEITQPQYEDNQI